MSDSGTVLLVERVIPAPNESSVAKWMDLNMLVTTGGRERTEAEFRSLFSQAAFELTRVQATRAQVSLIEGTPSRR